MRSTGPAMGTGVPSRVGERGGEARGGLAAGPGGRP